MVTTVFEKKKKLHENKMYLQNCVYDNIQFGSLIITNNIFCVCEYT